MTFFDRLTKETDADRKRFFNRKIVSTVLKEGASKKLYVQYLEQAYHHVRYTCPLLKHAIAKINEKHNPIVHAFEEYVEEETGHEEWILNDIAFMGGDKEKVRQGNGDYPVRSMISYMYNTIDTVSPQSLLGMVFVLEGTSVNIATESAEAIAKSLNINTKKGFSYLLSHGKLDISHLDFYKNLVNTIQDKTIQDQIIDTAKMIYYLWGNMFDEIYNKYHQLKEAA